jgi:beta-N-acetylglucosaminidase
MMREEIQHEYESDPEWQEEIAKRMAEFRETMDKPSN